MTNSKNLPLLPSFLFALFLSYNPTLPLYLHIPSCIIPLRDLENIAGYLSGFEWSHADKRIFVHCKSKYEHNDRRKVQLCKCSACH